MPTIEFSCKEEKSRIFGTIKRPRIEIEIFSKVTNEWIAVKKVLADTGADISVLPRHIGEMLVEDITTGKYVEIKGIQPSAVLIAFIHKLKLRINTKEIELPFAIADSNNVPSIFGRFKGLDLFDTNFLRGQSVKFNWNE